MKSSSSNQKLSTQYRKVPGFRNKPNECYYNAVSNLYLLNRPDLRYVEGLIVCDDYLIHHAWLECNDGIIECTLKNHQNKEYYSILSFSRKEMVEIRNKVSYPPASQLYQNKWQKAAAKIEQQTSLRYMSQQLANRLVEIFKS